MATSPRKVVTMAVQLPRVIPLPLAAEQIGLPMDVLTRLVKSGKIKAVQSDGTLLLDERTVRNMAKGIALRDRLWAKVAQFEGETVSTNDARTTYHLMPDTLYRCIRLGYIRAIDGPSKGGRGRLRRLNKADVAYIAELAKCSGGRGHRLLTPDTIPPHALDENKN